MIKENFTSLHDNIEMAEWKINIPFETLSYDFLVNMQVSVGVGNKFTLIIRDELSDFRWSTKSNGEYIDNSCDNIVLEQIDNYATLTIRGNVQRTTNGHINAHIYITPNHLNVNSTYELIGQSKNSKLGNLVFQCNNSLSEIQGNFLKGSNALIRANIKDDLKYVGLVGDSITNRYSANYDFFNDDKCINLGFNSQGTLGIYKKICKYDFSSYLMNIKGFVIMAGTNDVLFIKHGTRTYEEFEEDYIKIIDFLMKINPDITLVEITKLASVFKNGEGKDRDNKLIEKCNKIIRGIAADKNLKIINMNKWLINEEGYLDIKFTNDGLHLNEHGIIKFNKYLAIERAKFTE